MGGMRQCACAVACVIVWCFPVSALPTINPCGNDKNDISNAVMERTPLLRANRAIPLKGLNSVRIYVEIAEIAGVAGFDQSMADDITKIAVQKLANIGVKSNASAQSEDLPYLHLYGTYAHNQDGSLHTSGAVQLFQPVSLLRNPQTQFSVLTWARKREGVSPSKVAVGGCILESLDTFILDWLVANPISKPAAKKQE